MTAETTPIPTFPLKAPGGDRAVNDKEGNKFPALNLPSVETTPIPTFPL